LGGEEKKYERKKREKGGKKIEGRGKGGRKLILLSIKTLQITPKTQWL
jgi:hypothetical protein